MSRKFFLPILFFLLVAPSLTQAKDTYPRLANIYLKYFELVSPDEYNQLMKWDLLILPNETSLRQSSFLQRYKNEKKGIALAYTYPAMSLTLSHTLYSRIEQDNLWLRDKDGNKLQIWSGLYAVNLTSSRWQNMNIDFVQSKMNEGDWAGIMYDTVDSSINHYSRNGIDINSDGRVDDAAAVNSAWQRSMAELFKKTRSGPLQNKTMIMNGNSVASYQPDMNGRVFETFPTPWEGNGTWQATMYQYLRRLPPLNKAPQLFVINSNTNNTGAQNDYRKMRFGLTSTLLGDGYFSFDYGDQAHQQLWWYDEYDVALGRAESSFYNLLNNNSDFVEAGLWRRDFENGVSIVNSTTKPQLYIFKREQFEKIKGTQDRNMNDGSRVNYVRLNPNDGIIMRKANQDIVGTPFFNGHFVRVFNTSGTQVRNGFFAYRADLPSNAEVLYDDLNSDGTRDRISEQNGYLTVARGGRSSVRITPFGASFKGKLSFAAHDFNKDGSKEIVVAPASGGGPNVKIYSSDGKLLSAGFFVFDKNFRGGVSLTVGDINNDGTAEIIVAPGKGLAPTVKMFNDKGKLIGSFLAYDKKFRGGVNLVVGDADNDGKQDLVTGPMSGGPHVRVFDYAGRLKLQFMAFDASSNTGVSVMVADTDGDLKNEILAGTANF